MTVKIFFADASNFTAVLQNLPYNCGWNCPFRWPHRSCCKILHINLLILRSTVHDLRNLVRISSGIYVLALTSVMWDVYCQGQLELKLGLGGTSYKDFIRQMHLPMQLRWVLIALVLSHFCSSRIIFDLIFNQT